MQTPEAIHGGATGRPYREFLISVAGQTHKLIAAHGKRFQERVDEFIDRFHRWQCVLLDGQHAAIADKARLYLGSEPGSCGEDSSDSEPEEEEARKERWWAEAEANRPAHCTILNSPDYYLYNPAFRVAECDGYYYAPALPDNPVETLRPEKDLALFFGERMIDGHTGMIKREPRDHTEDLLRKYFLLAVIHAVMGSGRKTVERFPEAWTSPQDWNVQSKKVSEYIAFERVWEMWDPEDMLEQKTYHWGASMRQLIEDALVDVEADLGEVAGAQAGQTDGQVAGDRAEAASKMTLDELWECVEAEADTFQSQQSKTVFQKRLDPYFDQVRAFKAKLDDHVLPLKEAIEKYKRTGKRSKLLNMNKRPGENYEACSNAPLSSGAPNIDFYYPDEEYGHIWGWLPRKACLGDPLPRLMAYAGWHGPAGRDLSMFQFTIVAILHDIRRDNGANRIYFGNGDKLADAVARHFMERVAENNAERAMPRLRDALRSVKRILADEGGQAQAVGNGNGEVPAIRRAPRESEVEDDTPITLRDFMLKYCPKPGGTPHTESFIDGRKKALQDHPDIELPPHVGQWTRGKAKYFRPSQLMERWAEYCNIIPNLPAVDGQAGKEKCPEVSEVPGKVPGSVG